MKIICAALFLTIMLIMNSSTVFSKELVRGGNLDIVEKRLLDIENHHIDLEREEDVLDELKTKPAIHMTETALETAH